MYKTHHIQYIYVPERSENTPGRVDSGRVDPGRVDSGADLTSGRVDRLPFVEAKVAGACSFRFYEV